jgi:hypothetical protein
MKYVDEIDNLARGKYKGENVFEVADEDPGYLRWILDECSPDKEDREIISKALGVPVPEEG